MSAYYNEIEPYAAEWLRNLIAAGHIAPGVVDTRSIEDVHPADLQDFTQCHFFAGIGVWSLALRRAGWPDDRPVWTGSCPCQPFSAAGQGAGFADERHLWPAFHHLIRQRRPAVVIGEQVASKDVEPWIDLVQDDLEGVGYRFGAIPFPSAGVGAPHIRDRLYWVADAVRAGSLPGAHARVHRGEESAGPRDGESQRPGAACQLGHTGSEGLDERERGILSGAPGAVKREATVGAGLHTDSEQPGPTKGYWRDADWLGCRDGKFRPVEPGTFPLVDGAPARVGRLRAYGNAISAPAARVFIESVMEVS